MFRKLATLKIFQKKVYVPVLYKFVHYGEVLKILMYLQEKLLGGNLSLQFY